MNHKILIPQIWDHSPYHMLMLRSKLFKLLAYIIKGQSWPEKRPDLHSVAWKALKRKTLWLFCVLFSSCRVFGSLIFQSNNGTYVLWLDLNDSPWQVIFSHARNQGDIPRVTIQYKVSRNASFTFTGLALLMMTFKILIQTLQYDIHVCLVQSLFISCSHICTCIFYISLSVFCLAYRAWWEWRPVHLIASRNNAGSPNKAHFLKLRKSLSSI